MGAILWLLTGSSGEAAYGGGKVVNLRRRLCDGGGLLLDEINCGCE